MLSLQSKKGVFIIIRKEITKIHPVAKARIEIQCAKTRAPRSEIYATSDSTKILHQNISKGAYR